MHLARFFVFSLTRKFPAGFPSNVGCDGCQPTRVEGQMQLSLLRALLNRHHSDSLACLPPSIHWIPCLAVNHFAFVPQL
jgi:hypothetical protein